MSSFRLLLCSTIVLGACASTANPPWQDPGLRLSPFGLNFLWLADAGPSPRQSIEVRLIGDASGWSASTSEDWLQLGSSSGSSDATIPVWIDSAGKPPGELSATITVTETDSGWPETLAVTVTLQEMALPLDDFASPFQPVILQGMRSTDASLASAWYQPQGTQLDLPPEIWASGEVALELMPFIDDEAAFDLSIGDQTWSTYVGEEDYRTSYPIMMAPTIDVNTPVQLDTTLFGVWMPGWLHRWRIEERTYGSVFLLDLRESSPRVDASAATTNAQPNDSDLNTFWTGHMVVDISDVIASMSDPVIELTGVRDGDSTDITVLDGQGSELLYLWLDEDSSENAGWLSLFRPTDGTLDITADSSLLVNPFARVYDAADRGGTGLLLDIATTGSDAAVPTGDCIEVSGPDDYTYTWEDDVEYQGVHWSCSDGTGDKLLTFPLPSELDTWKRPVAELTWFVADGDTRASFDLLDGAGDVWSSYHMGDEEDDTGSLARHQLALPPDLNGTLTLRIPEYDGLELLPFVFLFEGGF